MVSPQSRRTRSGGTFPWNPVWNPPAGFFASAVTPAGLVGCPDCELLTDEQELAKRNYAMAVDLLFATGYRFNDNQYAALKNDVEETRAQWEIAQANLDRHKRGSHRV